MVVATRRRNATVEIHKIQVRRYVCKWKCRSAILIWHHSDPWAVPSKFAQEQPSLELFTFSVAGNNAKPCRSIPALNILFTHILFFLLMIGDATIIMSESYLRARRFFRLFLHYVCYEHWLQQTHTTSSQSAFSWSIGQPSSKSIIPVKSLYSRASFSAKRHARSVRTIWNAYLLRGTCQARPLYSPKSGNSRSCVGTVPVNSLKSNAAWAERRSERFFSVRIRFSTKHYSI